LEEGLALRKAIGDKDGIAFVCLNLARLAFWQGDYQRAITLCEESLAGYHEVGNILYVARTLSLMGDMARVQGDYGKAATINETVLAISRKAGEQFATAMLMGDLGRVAWSQGDYRQAAERFAEQLTIGRRMRIKLSSPMRFSTWRAWHDRKAITLRRPTCTRNSWPLILGSLTPCTALAA
jgi:tetratricopeptide (TPR) repeat protein